MSNELMENEAFINGVSMGIALYQQKIITAHKHRKFLKIGDELFYIQSGRERLQEMLEKICK